MFDFGKIIGKRVKAVRGFKERKNQKDIEVGYILFDDGKTFIEFNEQDYYAYHDCSTGAREITILEDKTRWDRIATNNDIYGDANMDL